MPLGLVVATPAVLMVLSGSFCALNSSPGDRSGIGETITTALRQPSFFWAWLLGGAGTLLALPITLFVAVMFDTFPETRWLAGLIGVCGEDTGTPAPDAEVEHT
jgi:hypothetical protein